MTNANQQSSDGKSSLKPCGTCNGLGTIKGAVTRQVCPECHGAMVASTHRKDYERATQRGEFVTK